MPYVDSATYENPGQTDRAAELARRTDSSKFRALLAALATTALVYIAFGSLLRFVLDTPYSDLRLILALPLFMNGITWAQLATESFLNMRFQRWDRDRESALSKTAADDIDFADYVLRRQLRRENLILFASATQLMTLALAAFFVLTRGRL